MRLLRGVLIAIAGLAVTSASNRHKKDDGGNNSFGGSNLYFLHALPDDVQHHYVSTLASWGVKVIRTWGKQNSCAILST